MTTTFPSEDLVDGILVDPVENDLSSGTKKIQKWTGLPDDIESARLSFKSLSFESFNPGHPAIDMNPGNGDGNNSTVFGYLANSDIIGLTTNLLRLEKRDTYQGDLPLMPHLLCAQNDAFVNSGYKFSGIINFQLVSASDTAPIWMIKMKVVNLDIDDALLLYIYSSLYWVVLTGPLKEIVLTSLLKKDSNNWKPFVDIGNWDDGRASLYVNGNY